MRVLFILASVFFFCENAQSKLIADYRIVERQLLVRWTTTDIPEAPFFAMKGFEIHVEGENFSLHKKIIPDTLHPLVKKWSKMNVSEEEQNMFGALYLLQCDTDSSFARAAGWMYSLPFRKNSIKKLSIRSLLTGETVSLEINPEQKFSLPKPAELKLKCRNGLLRLSFEVLHQEYAYYEIWRKMERGRWEKINAHPMVQLRQEGHGSDMPLVFFDTLETDSKAEYKYCGRTPFGEQGPFSELVQVTANPDFSAFPEPRIDSSNHAVTRIHVAWNNEKDKALCNKILLWVSPDGRQKAQLNYRSKDLSLLELPSLYGKGQRYFHVAYVHVNGDTLFADPLLHFVPDTEPPDKPILMAAIADTLGHVQLNWKAPNDLDLRGYRLFCRNAVQEEWTQISLQFIRDTFFIDTVSLHFLSTEKHYAVACSDSAFNSSGYSNTLVVQLPDRIPPPVPTFKTMHFRGDTLFLSWHAYDLGKPCKVMLHISMKDSVQTFAVASADTLITGLSGICRLSIRAMDASGNLSGLESATIEMPDEKKYALNVKARFISEKAAHVLSVQYPDAEIFRVDVLRKTDQGSWENLESFSNKETNDIMCKVKPGHRYRYMIVLVLKSGKKIKVESEDLLT
jgi:hypothetical protein